MFGRLFNLLHKITGSGRHGAIKSETEKTMPASLQNPAFRSAQVGDFLASFSRDVEAFRAQLPVLLQQWPGEYVAIFGGEVVDHKPSWEELAIATQKNFPDRYVLMEHVVPRTSELVDMDTLDS